MVLDEFYSQLQNDVISYSNNSDSISSLDISFKENAFTEILLEELSIKGFVESPAPTYIEFPKGNGIAKCNGFSIPDEDTKIDIIISSYFAELEIQKINQSDIEKLFLQAQRFVETALKKEGLDLFDFASEQHSVIKTIYDKSKDCDRINIILLSNALNVARKVDVKKQIAGKDVTFEIFDLERYQRLRNSGTTDEPIRVNLLEFSDKGIPTVTYQNKSGFSTSVLIVPGKLLFELYNKFGNRLLELNVRSYLQARGKVNKGILTTIQTEPDKFLTYNNGITVVAEELVFNEDQTRINEIIGMQIVNGGQTTASIHRAHKENKSSIDDVYVQAKITVVPANLFQEVVPWISEYSNTQNKVNSVDLGANNPYHIGIERVTKATWLPGQTSKWFYERARGSYETERARSSMKKFDIEFPPANKFTKEDLSRYENLWNLQPHIVSRGGQKNFVKFMEDKVGLYQKSWEPSQDEYKNIIGLAIFCRTVSKIARSIDIPAYRVNIVNYTTSLIVEKTTKRIDRKKIWESQAVTTAMHNLITEWINKMKVVLIDTANKDFPGENTGEVFKKDKCWEVLRKKTEDWKLPDDVHKELTNLEIRGTSGEEHTLIIPDIPRDVEDNMARCMQLSADQWFAIARWGATSGLLLEWQKGIANTLSGYAINSWTKFPSEKQAKHGVAIINLYQENQSNK